MTSSFRAGHEPGPFAFEEQVLSLQLCECVAAALSGSRIRRESGFRRKARAKPSNGLRIPIANILICRPSRPVQALARYMAMYRETARIATAGKRTGECRLG